MKTRGTVVMIAAGGLLILLGLAGSVGARTPADKPTPAGPSEVSVAISPLLQYQGRLTNPSTGQPVADGTYAMTFKLYDVASGGAPLWTETKNVSVAGGLFSTALGDTTPLAQSLFNGQALWLGITVGGDLEATPRQAVLPVAYALNLVPGAQIQGSNPGSAGILRVTNTGAGAALLGLATSSTGATYGVLGNAFSPDGYAVLGYSDGGATAVRGESDSTGPGVYGSSVAGVGVYGVNLTGGFAGFFSGNVHVTGDLSTSGAKPFKIDHPLDPANKYLYHYAVESPRTQNMYNGVARLDDNGEAEVKLPDYFSAVNTGEFSYLLTPIGAAMPNLHIAQEVQNNRFKIGGGAPGMKISWILIGQRNDAWVRDHPYSDVVDKPAGEQGKYLYPQGYGQLETMGVNYQRIFYPRAAEARSRR